MSTDDLMMTTTTMMTSKSKSSIGGGSGSGGVSEVGTTPPPSGGGGGTTAATTAGAVAVRHHSLLSSTAAGDSAAPPPGGRKSGAAIEEEDEQEMAQRRRDERVCVIRFFLMVALLTATAVVASFAGWHVKDSENKSFVMQYKDSVEKVGEAFQTRLDVKRDSIMTFSSMITSRYGPLGAWPNVTIPDFQEQTDSVLRIAEGRALSFNPIITQDVNRLQWEAHATESAWMLGGNDSVLIVPDPPNATWPDNRTVPFGIYSRDGDGNVVYDPGYNPKSIDYPDVLVPVWQIAPFAGNETFAQSWQGPGRIGPSSSVHSYIPPERSAWPHLPLPMTRRPTGATCIALSRFVRNAPPHVWT